MDDMPQPSHPVFRPVPHYYGDSVRAIFLMAAILIFLTESVGHDALLAPVTSIFFVLVLVIAAGVTNPAQRWIQWTDLLLSVIGLLIFGGSTLARYRADNGLFGSDFLIGIIALLFLLALYFATRTIRGSMLQMHPLHTVE